MTFDKNIWKNSIGWIQKTKLPRWPCPSCKEGKLILNSSTLITKETNKFKFLQDNKTINNEEVNFLSVLNLIANAVATYDDITKYKKATFNSFLSCDNINCNDVVSVSGSAKIPFKNDTNSMVLDTWLLPEYFIPPLQIIKICDECPVDVRSELIKSFSLFFCDTASSGNRVRASIELILDSFNVKKFHLDENGETKKSSNGRVKIIRLHDRIVDFSKSNNHLGEILLAIKLLGNEASHGNDVSQKDLIEVYAVMDYLIEELYIRPNKQKNALLLSAGISDKFSK